MRTQIVEFLSDVYLNHPNQSEVNNSFAEGDLYNKLLFFFEYRPFHNVLHQKFFAIVEKALSESYLSVTVNHLLYQTSLIKRILDTSSDHSSNTTANGGGFHVFG